MQDLENNPFTVEAADDSSGFLLWQVTNLWQREIRKILEPLDLTHSQFVLLASIQWLTIQKTEITQILLSHHTKIDPMTTSQVLRTLLSKGLIERREHKTDTRAKVISITAKGSSIASEAVKAVEQFDKKFFSILGTDVQSFNKNLKTLL